MTYHRKVSRKKDTKSMIYMTIRVNAVWLVHKLPPKNLLLLILQFRINRTLITCTRQNDEDPSEYADSLPLPPK